MATRKQQDTLYTPDERRQMVDLYENGLKLEEVATKIGCCTATVLNALRERGVKLRRVIFSPKDRQRMVDLYKSGLTQQGVATAIGCSNVTVIKALRKQGVKTRRPILSAEDRRQMIALAKSGQTSEMIAQQFGCRVSTVQKVLRNLGLVRGGTDGRRKFSPADCRRMVSLYESGLTQEEVAAKMGCSVATVRRIRRQQGIKARQIPLSPKEQQRVAKLYQSGLTQAEVAEKVGRHLGAVRKALRDQGIKMRRCGRQHNFSQHERRQMAKLYEEGWSLPEIAEEFHCSHYHVEFALHRLDISTVQPPPKLVRRGHYSPKERQQMADLYESGLTLRQVAVRIGCNVETVMNTLRALGIERRQTDNHSRFSLTDRQRMASMTESGMTTREIAAHFNCDSRYVGRVVYCLGVTPITAKYPPQVRQQMVDLYKSGLTRKEVAEQVGCSVSTVQSALYERGVAKPQNRGSHSRSPQDRNRMAALYKSGSTLAEVAAKFDCGADSVRAALYEHGVKIRGANDGRRKFSQEDYQRMARMYKEGVSTPKIAVEFGCDKSHVRYVLQRLGVKIVRKSAKQPASKTSSNRRKVKSG